MELELDEKIDQGLEMLLPTSKKIFVCLFHYVQFTHFLYMNQRAHKHEIYLYRLSHVMCNHGQKEIKMELTGMFMTCNNSQGMKRR